MSLPGHDQQPTRCGAQSKVEASVLSLAQLAAPWELAAERPQGFQGLRFPFSARREAALLPEVANSLLCKGARERCALFYAVSRTWS